MAINPITQTIPLATDSPTINNPDTFNVKAEYYVNTYIPLFISDENTLVIQLNTFASEVNAEITNIDNNVAICTTKANDASLSASNASTSASNASTSENNALNYKNLSLDWATSSGLVESLDYSSKAYANSVGLITTGSSKDWSISSGLIDSDYSSKSWAVSIGVIPDKSSKEWALISQVNGTAPSWISGNSYNYPDVVTSPITFQSYRAKNSTNGIIDPSQDLSNWEQLTGATIIGAIDGGVANSIYTSTTTIDGGGVNG